jgi:peptide/nickel transport system ATP-binding protein
MSMVAPEPLLAVDDLSVSFASAAGRVLALRHVSLAVKRGAIMGIVGESGSGKSTLIGAATRLLPGNAEVRGNVRFDGQDLLALKPTALRALRGTRIAMVFQDPMTTLNPVLSIGQQMVDIQYRDPRSFAAKRTRAASMLDRVGIPDAVSRLSRHPHEFSGGMRQRIAIAMALLGNPDLLIADEPTTALDVTMEAQIIHLLRALRRDFQGSILFVSHNLGLVAELCDEVTILYAGEVMEQGPVREILLRPQHPYTRALLACDPARIPGATRVLPTIGGEVPNLVSPPPGCVFAPRCRLATEVCTTSPSFRRIGPGHAARCHKVGT